MTDTDRVRHFLAKRAQKSGVSGAALRDDTTLFGGVLDSFGVLELVAFLEEYFLIRVEKEDIDAGHLRTIARIAAFLNAKKSSKRLA
jgi:acyl carrier protein